MRLMRKLLEKIRIGNEGQTALEYALVIAVIAVVIIAAAKALFSDPEKGVQRQVFEKSVKSVSDINFIALFHVSG